MKKTITRLFFALFVIDAGLHLLSTQLDGGSFNYITKVLLMPLLGAYALNKESYTASRIKISLGLALFFSWIGDALLGFSGDIYFLSGLGSFLVGHVIYIFAYGYASGTYPLKIIWKRWWYWLPIVGYGFSFLAWLWPKLDPAMQYPVAGYAMVLVAMLLAAAGRGKYTHPTSFILVLWGAVSFVLSDSMIAVNRFAEAIPQGSLLIMSTYILGQWMIAEGLLNHPSPAKP